MTSNAEIAKAMAENMTHAAVPLYGKKLRLPDRGAIIGILNVRHQCLLYAGQLLQYLMGQCRRGKGLALRQRQRHLCRQRRLDTLQQQCGVVLRR